MTLAELFVKIVVKGGDTASKSLIGVSKSMSSLASTSLETKAAVAGLLYGLERLTGFAAKNGMELYKYGQLTGQSTLALQEWQHALRLAGVSSEETQSTFLGLQDAITKMKLAGGASSAFKIMADAVNLDPAKIKDTAYLMGKITEFVKKAPPEVAALLGKELGLSQNMIASLRVVNLERDKGLKKDKLTNREVKDLAQTFRDWQTIWLDLENIGNKLVAHFGGFAVKEFSDAIKALKKMGGVIAEVAESAPAMKAAMIALAAVFAIASGPAGALAVAITAIVVGLAELNKLSEGRENMISDMLGGGAQEQMTGWKALIPAPLKMAAAGLQEMLAPKGMAVAGAQGGTVNNVVINANVKDGKDLGQRFNAEVQRAALKNPSVNRRN